MKVCGVGVLYHLLLYNLKTTAAQTGLNNTVEILDEYEPRPPVLMHHDRRINGIHEYQLVTNLINAKLSSYVKSLRPLQNSQKNVNVRVDLILRQIFKVEETEQTVFTKAWMKIMWTDEKFRWNAIDYCAGDKTCLFSGQQRGIQMKRNSLWTPDILLYNGETHLETDTIPTYVKVAEDGLVTMEYKATYKTSCTLHVRYFPYDYQECNIALGSWVYDQEYLRLAYENVCGDFTLYLPHEEWIVISYFAARHHNNQMDDDAASVLRFDKVVWHMLMRRRPLYYLLNLGFPSFLVAIIGLISFFTPTDTTGERSQKIQMGLTALMNMTLLLLVVSHHIPGTSQDVPLISLYYSFLMFIVSLATMVSSLILEMQHTASEVHPVPVWLKVIVFKYLGKLLCMMNQAQRHKEYILQKHILRFVEQELKRFNVRKFQTTNPTMLDERGVQTPGLPKPTKQHVGTMVSIQENLLPIVNMADTKEDRLQKFYVIERNRLEWLTVADIIERLLLIMFLFGTIIITTVTIIFGNLKSIYLDESGLTYPNMYQKCLQNKLTQRVQQQQAHPPAPPSHHGHQLTHQQQQQQANPPSQYGH